MRLFYLFFISCCFSQMLLAEEFQSTEAFLNEVFTNNPPKAQSFWLTKPLKKTVQTILRHKAGFMRTRYWQTAQQTVWILHEIGKMKPITVAVVIKNHTISRIKVLHFRESRGWEVKHDFFTRQFKGTILNAEYTLNKAIDGISGATLSVNALKKIARLALFFDQQLHTHAP